MNLRGAKNYNIGLDIGTGSVGWAVTDEFGELYHFKGKPTWGSRLFPTAETAATTRVTRGQRRRYDRRRQRLNLLQGLFADEMSRIDPEFFIRMNQSRLLKEDRKESCSDYRWPLFNDGDFSEQDYYDKFPTIYHLRSWLMEAEEKADIRLVYLAFHNIVKTRGNFLHQDNKTLSAKNANMKESIDALCEAVESWCDEHECSCSCDRHRILAIFEDDSMYAANKRDVLPAAFGFSSEDKQRAKEISKAILGYKADFAKIFDIEGEGTSIYLSNDEQVEAFVALYGEAAPELFEAMQAAYSSYILMGILKGADGQTISYCKVKEYERYASDLALLKKLVHDYAPEEYDTFFRGPHYPAPYQKDYDASKAKGYTRYNLGISKLSYDDFRKEVEKLFKNTGAVEDQRYSEMMDAFKEEKFLRRLKTSDNGSIPYQLHLEEMDAIIERQGQYYPFLVQDREKIESLVSFRIPYYVGPLTTKNAAKDSSGKNRFAWSVRKEGMENAAIRPWNWEEIIDKDKSAEAFILRMTGTCTYLQGEPVLPKCSLLYEKYCVLNEFNGARWSQDGDKWVRFSASDRKDIFEDLFMKRKSVSYKAVEDWLKRNGRSNPHVKGGQGERGFESKLSSYRFFAELLGAEELNDSDRAMAEEIILWNTLFEDHEILKDKIQRSYGDRLESSQIGKICRKRFTGWGRLSKAFLCEVKANTPDGKKSIMDILEEGCSDPGKIGYAMVLMEILHDDNLGFELLIDDFNKRRLSGNSLHIEDLPGSPALRRSVNQAIRIVEEIVRIAGSAPANIFIEVTREDNKNAKGRRTTSRYNNIKEALASLKAEGLANPDIVNQLKEISPGALDERLTLYFMQNGKSLYSGKPLDIRRVMSGDQSYQVDHIIPQSYVKDDSFENKALVLSDENQKKTDALLIDPEIRRKMSRTWRQLKDAGLIGEKKYRNLMASSISDERMRGFINRQLVETSQEIKLVRALMAEKYPETHIRSIKASLSSQLRQGNPRSNSNDSPYLFPKSRSANNYHHAHDAFLACEIGRFIEYRYPAMFDNPIVFTHAMRKFIQMQSEEYKKYHRMPGSATFVIGSFFKSGFDKETGEIIKDEWDAEAEIQKIKRCLNYKQCYISRMPEITTGTFWDATIYSPKEAGKKLSLPLKKGLDASKYGSYSREQFAYFFVYKAKKKNKYAFEFEAVPVSVAAEIEKDPNALEAFAERVAQEKGLEFVCISKRRIPKYQLVEIDGEKLYITGMKELRNASELAFSVTETEILRALEQGESLEDGEIVQLLRSIAEKYDKCACRLEKQMNLKYLLNNCSNIESSEGAKLVKLLVSIASAQTNMIDISSIGGAKYAGCLQMKFSKELTKNWQSFIFVNRSVTGMFEKRETLEL